MRVNSRSTLLGFTTVLIVLFVALLVGIFQLRSGSGDVFKPYSTYRSDPLGTMALHNALSDVEGVTVERYLRPYDELPDGNGKTLLLPGAALSLDPLDAIEAIEGFAAQGGRVVLAFQPQTNGWGISALRNAIEMRDGLEQGRRDSQPPGSSGPSPDESDPPGFPGLNEEPMPDEDAEDVDSEDGDSEATEEQSQDTGKTEEAAEEDESTPGMWGPKLLDISERWPFAYDFEDPGTDFQTIPPGEDEDSDAGVTWVSGLYFKYPDDKWSPLYIRPGGTEELPRITVMEREMGAGVIVLSSDSYFLSNEALRERRASQFINTVVLGENDTILFSEVHLGTEQRERIMTLVRRYRLHGVLFALVLLGVLFVWKNATTLVPRAEMAPAREGIPSTALERSHQDGLDNLLARFIPSEQLLDTCVTEWMHQFHRSPKAPEIQQLRDALAAPGEEKSNVVEAYNRLANEVRKH